MVRAKSARAICSESAIDAFVSQTGMPSFSSARSASGWGGISRSTAMPQDSEVRAPAAPASISSERARRMHSAITLRIMFPAQTNSSLIERLRGSGRGGGAVG